VLELHVEEARMCSVGNTVSELLLFFFFLANDFFRKNSSCDYCRNRKIRCAGTEAESKRKRDRAGSGGPERKRKRSEAKGKQKAETEEDGAEWRRRMELRVAEMEERIMARLDRGFRHLGRRMLALEHLVDEDWAELVGRPDPEESEGESEEDTEMGNGEESGDGESEAEVEEVAGDAMEE
jgi:hypothetical protein